MDLRFPPQPRWCQVCVSLDESEGRENFDELRHDRRASDISLSMMWIVTGLLWVIAGTTAGVQPVRGRPVMVDGAMFGVCSMIGGAAMLFGLTTL